MKKTFNYKAKDKNGKDIKGKILAESHSDAWEYLNEQHYTDIEVRKHFNVDE